MPHGPEHHLEEAEHAKHAAHVPFDRKVALSMAIIAATLAIDTLMSHREHNESSTMLVEAVDTWGRYQAKKNRGYLYEVQAELSDAHAAATTGPASEKFAKIAAKLEKAAQKQKSGTKTIEDRARSWKRGADESHHRSVFFDFGELGLELGLVLCSVALLSKSRIFWLTGVLVAVVGLGIAVYGFAFIHPQVPPPEDEARESAVLRVPGDGAAPG